MKMRPALALLGAIFASAQWPLPKPSQAQLDFLSGPSQFMHFGMCTFHGCQQNTPFFPAETFNPTNVDTDQWMTVAKSWGAKRVCLTAHHTGGFALWPTKVYNYSVAQSPYQGGNGDIVRDFVTSCRKFAIEPCLYIIPSWDDYVLRTTPNITSDAYLQTQLDMLTELLTLYGPIERLWWDNYMLQANQVQPQGDQPAAFVGSSLATTWKTIIGHVKQISPNTYLLPGPDGCLNPGEAGDGVYPVFNYENAPAVYWSCANRAPAGPNATAGYFFAPKESDFSILQSDNWFWASNDQPYTPDELFSHYTLSVGQGSNLILNIPPDDTGSIPDDIVAAATGLGTIINQTYGTPVSVASNLPVTAPCPQLSVILPLPTDGSALWDQTVLVEDLSPQLITKYAVDYHDPSSGAWTTINASIASGFHGLSVGARVVDWGMAPVAALKPDQLRFRCVSSIDDSQPATITNFAAYLGKMSAMQKLEETAAATKARRNK